MNNVKVLLIGEHKKIPHGLLANSTVTLIQTEGKNIIVDSGSFGDRAKLIESLKHEGLTPDDVDIVIVTHTHLDHTANLHMFSGAEIMAKHSPQSTGILFHGCNNEIRRINVDNLEITKGVRIILTPGHVEAHISVVVETEEGKYVVCGDAIQTAHLLDIKNKPEKAWNFEQFEKSRMVILDIADYIIPGHGDIVKVPKRKIL